jgi:hypothetical protein
MTDVLLLDRPRVRVRFDEDICAAKSLDQLRVGCFTVHGETHAIGDPVDWLHNPSDDIEWHIVLHKFFHAPGLVQAWIESGDAAYFDLC